jgi:hypothetical protein
MSLAAWPARRQCSSVPSRMMSARAASQVGRIDRQLPGERTAEDAVGRNQRFQALVDLAVHALAALLDGLHHQHADAHPEQGKHGETEEGRQDRLPRTEIQIAHIHLCKHFTKL